MFIATKRAVTPLLAVFALVAVPALAKPAIQATLWHNPGCQCCAEYTHYLDQRGFDVKVVASSDLAAVFREHAVPGRLASCHLMTVGRYTVVGHVPVDAVQKLLREHPAVRGISLPGMPAGSPGMSGPKQAPFVNYAFGAGKPKIYATR